MRDRRRPFRRPAPGSAPRRGSDQPDDVTDALSGPLAFLADPDQFLPRFILSLALQPPRFLAHLRPPARRR